MSVLRYGRDNKFDTSISLKEDGEFVCYADYVKLVNQIKKIINLDCDSVISNGKEGNELYTYIEELKTMIEGE